MSSRSSTTSSGPVTIYEVAKAAGVSIGTASRVLNGGNKEVWASTAKRAERIRQIARELGYTPSWRGRTLAAKKTWTIGLIQTPYFPLCTGPYEAMLLALSDTLSRSNYHVTFVRMEHEDRQHPLLSQGLDGVIAYHVVPDNVIEALRTSACPVVILNAVVSEPFPTVLADDRQGAQLAANYLHELGHRRVITLSWISRPPYNLLPHFSTACRREAFRERFIELDPRSVVQPVEETEDRPMSHLIDEVRRLRATAIVVDTSDQALPLLHELWQAGFRVPDQISVLSWNNLPWTRYSIPPLTVIETPMEQMGRVAAERLLTLIEKGDPNGHQTESNVVLPEKLLIRSSTGRAVSS
ncbi:MAG: transcriptional regulator [Phycisphaerae bacterium]|jgi:LacI family transcriptional regulator|nr:MAG: transcriptional regulator [Phycisphaerae bacterium]